MDYSTVKAMLEQHFASSDPDVAHEMYHDDAVLEFPQSGERFAGVENLREWRSNYPASTRVEFRDIRGRDDLWVAEVSIRYDQGPWNFGVSILELREDKIARESIYVTEGWEPPEWRAQWRSAPQRRCIRRADDRRQGVPARERPPTVKHATATRHLQA